MNARLLRRRFRVFVRNLIRLDEDDIRERLIEGLRRDNEQLASTLGKSVAVVNQVTQRLTFYEATVPQLVEAKKRFDKQQRRAHKANQARREEYERLVASGVSPEDARERVQPRVTKKKPL